MGKENREHVRKISSRTFMSKNVFYLSDVSIFHLASFFLILFSFFPFDFLIYSIISIFSFLTKGLLIFSGIQLGLFLGASTRCFHALKTCTFFVPRSLRRIISGLDLVPSPRFAAFRAA